MAQSSRPPHRGPPRMPPAAVSGAPNLSGSGRYSRTFDPLPSCDYLDLLRSWEVLGLLPHLGGASAWLPGPTVETLVGRRRESEPAAEHTPAYGPSATRDIGAEAWREPHAVIAHRNPGRIAFFSVTLRCFARHRHIMYNSLIPRRSLERQPGSGHISTRPAITPAPPRKLPKQRLPFC